MALKSQQTARHVSRNETERLQNIDNLWPQKSVELNVELLRNFIK